MKISLEWLNSYLDKPVTVDEAERVLTDQGLPIEERIEAGDDVVLDVEVTSNRPDCLSHVGVAREVAAGLNRALQLPDCSLPAESGDPVTKLTSVENEDVEACPVYTARVITGVKVGPSPDWMVRRLESIGMRSINNVVDATNFVLMELGQPLHAFDMARLDERRIVVRSARSSETFDAIDGTSHRLEVGMLAIADAHWPVAMGGIMGGSDSEVGGASVDILLESAMFAPLSIRRTSRRLKLASDSSYRFERGIDPEGVELASRRAARLIVELAGGTLAPGVIRAGIDTPSSRTVTMRLARCSSLLGLGLSATRVVDWLGRLGLDPSLDDAGDVVTCVIPSFRLDLWREVDLIEEVARLHGLDDIPVQQKIHIEAKAPQTTGVARQEVGHVLVAHGYHETVDPTFLSERHGRPFLPSGSEAVMAEDDRRKAEPMLRPSLAPSLLACRKANQDVGNVGVRLFELAATWLKTEQCIVERRLLTMLADVQDRQQGLRDMRGAIQELAARLIGSATVSFAPIDHAWLADAAEVAVGENTLGAMGIVDETHTDLFGLQTQVAVAELDAEALLAAYPPSRQVGRLPRFPGIERDLSLIVPERVAWRDIEQALRKAEPAMLESLTFLGAYRGKPIPKGTKSVSLRMFFRDPDRTLRHEQVDSQVEAVVACLKSAVNAELRS